MKLKKLCPSQIITTRDFQVYSNDVLEKYFEIYRSGKGQELPPVPLIHKNLVMPHFENEIWKILMVCLEKNPQAEYFLLNGSHRTTSATLTHHSIEGVLLRTEEDISQANQIRYMGEKYWHDLHPTIIKNIKDLADHFRGTLLFQTVQEKTNRMVEEKVIAQLLINNYESIK